MADPRKRKGGFAHGNDGGKKSRGGDKGRRQFHKHQQSTWSNEDPGITPGEAGIWATCDKGKEGKCVSELRDLLEDAKEYARKCAEKLYGESSDDEGGLPSDGAGDEDIESTIQREVQDMKRPKRSKLFTAVRIDVQCLVFFKTRAPVEPVLLVQRICEDAASCPEIKKSRFVQRLTPLTLIGRASENGLQETAAKVLAPHFHQDDGVSKKFAIRTSIRNHNTLKRTFVIDRVAAAVGPRHSVDLTNYDLLILVDIYRNICGMSVVRSGYEQLRRYNLAEIYDPTPKDAGKAISTSGAAAATAGVGNQEPKVSSESETRLGCESG